MTRYNANLIGLSLLAALLFTGCAGVKPVDTEWEADRMDFRYLAATAEKAANAYQCREELMEAYREGYETFVFYETFLGLEAPCRYTGPITYHRAYVLIPRCNGQAPCRKERFIVIKGTETIGDWLVNMVVNPGDDETYHKGFRRAAIRLLDDINDWKAIEADELVTLVGHSKGGAVAMSLFYHLVEEGHPPELLRLVTFGQPRVNQRTDDPHTGRMMRVVMEGDPVPFLPPYAEAIGLRYRHNSPAIHLLYSGMWRYKEREAPEPTPLADYGLSLLGTNPDTHGIRYYVQRLHGVVRKCGKEEPDESAPGGKAPGEGVVRMHFRDCMAAE